MLSGLRGRRVILPCAGYLCTGKTAAAFDTGTAFVIAIDMASSALLWKVPIIDSEWPYTAGQFPVVRQGGQRRVVFSIHTSGARAIGLADDN